MSLLQIEEPITQQRSPFQSNLFGSLGVGVFESPNLIDFSTVFDNIDQKILDNLAVFLTVTLTILLYIPLVIQCRKYDRLDGKKVSAGIAYSTIYIVSRPKNKYGNCPFLLKIYFGISNNTHR